MGAQQNQTWELNSIEGESPRAIAPNPAPSRWTPSRSFPEMGYHTEGSSHSRPSMLALVLKKDGSSPVISPCPGDDPLIFSSRI